MFDDATKIKIRGYDIIVLDEAMSYRSDLEKLEDQILVLATYSRGWGNRELDYMRTIFKIYPLYLATSLALIVRDSELEGIAGCDTAFEMYPEANIVHLCSMNFSREIQRNGILTVLFLVMLDHVLAKMSDADEPIYFTSISQSPLVYSMLQKFSDVYPNWEASPPPDVIKTAEAVVKKYDPDVTFETANLILRSECDFFYKNLPKASDDRINKFVEDRLNIDQGDVFVTVGKSSLAQASQYGERFRSRFASSFHENEGQAINFGGNRLART